MKETRLVRAVRAPTGKYGVSLAHEANRRGVWVGPTNTCTPTRISTCTGVGRGSVRAMERAEG